MLSFLGLRSALTLSFLGFAGVGSGSVAGVGSSVGGASVGSTVGAGSVAISSVWRFSRCRHFRRLLNLRRWRLNCCLHRLSNLNLFRLLATRLRLPLGLLLALGLLGRQPQFTRPQSPAVSYWPCLSLLVRAGIDVMLLTRQ